MEKIMTPNFKGRATIIFEEIRTREIDTEVIVEIIADALEEGYELGSSDGYYEGHSDGYSLGYNEGTDDALCGIVAYKRPRQP